MLIWPGVGKKSIGNQKEFMQIKLNFFLIASLQMYGLEPRQLHYFSYIVTHFHGQGITPVGLFKPRSISETSQELGLLAASFSLEIVRS